MSQDHLELLFSAIRCFGGWNNNPSSIQFANAYRSLLGHVGVSMIAEVRTNCVAQDATSILNVESKSSETPAIMFSNALKEHDYLPNVNRLSPFVEGIVEYIGGFVVRRVCEKVSCTQCAHSLVQLAGPGHHSGLLHLKNNGGLVIPSEDVCTILKHCETLLRSSLNIKHVRRDQWEKMTVLKLMSDMPTNLFSSLENHFLATARGIDSHYSTLVRLLCESFLKVRRNHSVFLTNLELHGVSIRQSLNKAVIFRNQ